MRVVYVAGPYRANNAWQREQNIREAEEQAFEIAHMGVVPLVPHTMYRHFDGTLTDDFWLDGTLELLRRSDALFLCPRWETSKGTLAEKRWAEDNALLVFDSLITLNHAFGEPPRTAETEQPCPPPHPGEHWKCVGEFGPQYVVVRAVDREKKRVSYSAHSSLRYVWPEPLEADIGDFLRDYIHIERER